MKTAVEIVKYLETKADRLLHASGVLHSLTVDLREACGLPPREAVEPAPAPQDEQPEPAPAPAAATARRKTGPKVADPTPRQQPKQRAAKRQPQPGGPTVKLMAALAARLPGVEWRMQNVCADCGIEMGTKEYKTAQSTLARMLKAGTVRKISHGTYTLTRPMDGGQNDVEKHYQEFRAGVTPPAMED